MKQTAQSGMIATQNQKQVAQTTDKPKSLKDLLEARMGEIQKVLPSVITPQQFLRLSLNALQNTPHLMECTMTSFYGAVMQCAQLGLKPNVNGEGYLLPYKNNKKGVYECQFIPGYKGLMLLARRSGEIASIDAQTVYENDEFDLSYGFEPNLIHKPYLKGNRGKVTGFYATVILKDGGKNAHYMTVEDALAYGKKYSKSFSSGPWQTDFEAMAKKSCLRQVLKYAPMSTDVETALAADSKFEDNPVTANMFELQEDEVEMGGETAQKAFSENEEKPTAEELAEALSFDSGGVVTNVDEFPFPVHEGE